MENYILRNNVDNCHCVIGNFIHIHD